MVLPALSMLADHHFDGLIVGEVGLEFQNLAELQMDVLLVQRWAELHYGEAGTVAGNQAA